MNLIKGETLNPVQRTSVKSAFVHRYTGEHKPQWANKTMPNGNEYKPQFKTDNDWIKAYAFYFKDNGELANKPGYCVPVNLMDTFTKGELS